MRAPAARFRRRQMLGQYRIEKLLAKGATAEVFAALDTALGIRVALKVPHSHLDATMLDCIRQEIRLVAKLEHPNIMPIRTASEIDGHLVIVQPLGTESLADRLARRMSRERVLEVAGQLFRALAHAHAKRVAHCDVKPDNIVLFEDGLVRLADFGLARFAIHSIEASGSGTVGFMAPEQALGRPSVRSDVFSAGLVLYRMMAGDVPEWPFEWPYPGLSRARRGYHIDLLELVRHATRVDSRRRFEHAGPLLEAFERIRPYALLARPRVPATPAKRTSTKRPPRRA
ncbi:MAG: serine/threonine-protein kinase [Planctomycetota bacterium]